MPCVLDEDRVAWEDEVARREAEERAEEERRSAEERRRRKEAGEPVDDEKKDEDDVEEAEQRSDGDVDGGGMPELVRADGEEDEEDEEDSSGSSDSNGSSDTGSGRSSASESAAAKKGRRGKGKGKGDGSGTKPSAVDALADPASSASSPPDGYGDIQTLRPRAAPVKQVRSGVRRPGLYLCSRGAAASSSSSSSSSAPLLLPPAWSRAGSEMLVWETLELALLVTPYDAAGREIPRAAQGWGWLRQRDGEAAALSHLLLPEPDDAEQPPGPSAPRPGAGLPRSAAAYHIRFVWRRCGDFVAEQRITCASPRTGSVAGDMVRLARGWRAVAATHDPLLVFAGRDAVRAGCEERGGADAEAAAVATIG